MFDSLRKISFQIDENNNRKDIERKGEIPNGSIDTVMMQLRLLLVFVSFNVRRIK
jgi:hypothetical protein